jgi:outer membrane lipoprotein-sorting protein
MISGSPTNNRYSRKNRRQRRLLQTFLIVLGLLLAAFQWGMSAQAAPAPNPNPWNLPQLLSLLSARGDSEARFVELKNMAVLDKPLRLEGTVVFRRPDYLAKHVLKPVEEHYIIDGNTVTVEKPADGTRTQLSLADYPALQAFAASLRAPLAGDGAALSAYYRASLGGTREHWLLALAPLRPEMAQVVRLVKLQGSGDRVERLDIEEAGGDTSSMRFEPQP